jgi:hypothetical protein
MSWHWSQLSTLAFLALLYLSPLSSGDKGLWLSVTSLPVRSLGAISGGVPPEHLIVLPDRVRLAPFAPRIERSEPALGPTVLATDAPVAREWSEWPGYTTTWSALDEVYSDSAAPRGPPL